ncbi:alginate export family protein [Anatilimnocola sp. NA78]|uniref:alginate export family protein n=1 Tax=Anatilimnocola sp. NA78 TaxID=3415683 RepID=UPI003CE59938
MNARMRRLALWASAFCLLGVTAQLQAETFPVTENHLPEAEIEISSDDGEFPVSLSADAASIAAPACNCPECQKKAAAADAKKKAADLKKAVATAYAPVFYNNKFAYINNPLYNDWYPGDDFKQIPLGCDSMLDIGGQYRARYQHENNIRGLGLTGNDDDFLLHRTRLFANLKIGDRLRFYGEYIDAESNHENFPQRAIEVNRSDMLNLFVDYKLYENCCGGSLTGRVGRQELLYGSERLISPLDWANTRRTFEGIKFMWTDADWNLDVFFTEPVAVHPIRFDSAIDEQEFFGGWATYKAIKDQTIDLYALQFNNSLGFNNFQYTTMGGRWLGTECDWLWELEGGIQFGQNTAGNAHDAAFWTVGYGKKWSEHCWKPQVMAYYDWAEGGDVRGAGQGFNHLFPLAHKYLGFMDLFGRSNIETPNVQFTCQPHEKWKVLVWYYYFFLQNANDTPYNVNMTPFNPANAPASRDLGHELDITATYAINARMDLLFGYSHFWAGQYYANTPPGFSSNANFFYMQYQWNF